MVLAINTQTIWPTSRQTGRQLVSKLGELEDNITIRLMATRILQCSLYKAHDQVNHKVDFIPKSNTQAPKFVDLHILSLPCSKMVIHSFSTRVQMCFLEIWWCFASVHHIGLAAHSLFLGSIPHDCSLPVPNGSTTSWWLAQGKWERVHEFLFALH